MPNNRRAELRKLANAHFDAQEKDAIAKLELHSLDVQQTLIASSLTTEQARQFLEKMPTVDSLMPPLNEGEVQKMLESKIEKEPDRYSRW